jgi:uncharacterized protein with FMN-binding domain
MSGVSLVVLGLSVRASMAAPRHLTVLGTAPVGVVAAAPAPTTAAVPPAAAPPAHAAARKATHRPVAPAVHHAAPAHTAASSPAARPVASPKPVVTTYTVTGPAVDTGQFGPVQVRIKVRGHRIVAADAIEYPQGTQSDRDRSSYAIPQLDDETLQAQSARIDTVSGVTYTSEAYIQSLQAAIDQAHGAGIL